MTGAYSNKGSSPAERLMAGDFTEADMRAAVPADLIRRINGACAEIGREIGYRRAVYPRLVAQGKLSNRKADEQIAALEDAAKLLRELSGVQR